MEVTNTESNGVDPGGINADRVTRSHVDYEGFQSTRNTHELTYVNAQRARIIQQTELGVQAGDRDGRVRTLVTDRQLLTKLVFHDDRVTHVIQVEEV